MTKFPRHSASMKGTAASSTRPALGRQQLHAQSFCYQDGRNQYILISAALSNSTCVRGEQKLGCLTHRKIWCKQLITTKIFVYSFIILFSHLPSFILCIYVWAGDLWRRRSRCKAWLQTEARIIYPGGTCGSTWFRRCTSNMMAAVKR